MTAPMASSSKGAARSGKPRIRVLLADDSSTMRGALSALLAEESDMELVGQASDGDEAVALARALKPDVITMDVQMPRLNGLDAIAQIMSQAPCRIVVVCSVSEDRLVDLSLRATSVGALELVAKPSAQNPGGLRRWGKELAQTLRALKEVPVGRRRTRSAKATTGPLSRPSRHKASIIGIVSSTGGPAALAQLLAELPGDFPIPILIAQHLPKGFGSGLIRWFSEVSKLTILEAIGRTEPKAGCVYLPPDGCDLHVDKAGLLRTGANVGSLCPSGDRLLSSLASVYGQHAVGVVLTGLGRDGAQGLLEIRQAGGHTIAQDAASSVVYGMPRAAKELGGVVKVLPLSRIGAALEALVATELKLGSPSP